MFEKHFNQQVKIVQKDGFVKSGKLVDEDIMFIKLIFRNGKPHYIEKAEIKTLDPIQGVVF